MDIVDSLHGTIHIESLALQKFIVSPAFQRLKKINQHGLPVELWNIPPFTRYDHSIGVMLLLKRLGASEEEQIAGLLHDVSHTAFSHLIDWVLGENTIEDFQDRELLHFITSHELADILVAYGYQPKDIAHTSSYSLLEQEAPDLCADRVDYALREFAPNIAHLCIEGLINKDGRIICKDLETAYLFATNYLHYEDTIWSSFEGVSRYLIFAQVLRYALDKKILVLDDFWQYDAYIIQKLHDMHDPWVESQFKILSQETVNDLPKSPTPQMKKFRYVDPLCMHGNNIVRVSEIHPKFAHELEKRKEQNKKGIFVIAIPSYTNDTTSQNPHRGKIQ